MRKLAGPLAGLALMLCAPLAHADYVISYQFTSPAGTATQCADSADNTLASCFGSPTSIGNGVTVTELEGTSTSPGDPTMALQTGSVTKIQTTGAVTLDIWLAAQDFTAPNTPPSIDYQTSLTLIPTTGTGSVTLENCIDTSNGTAPPNGTFCSTNAATLNNGPLAYSGTTSVVNNNSSVVNSLTGTFSLSQEIQLTLGANTILEVQTRQILSSVPEPAAPVLFGTMLLAISFLFRKKLASRPS